MDTAQHPWSLPAPDGAPASLTSQMGGMAMPAEPAPVSLRPLNLGDVLDGAFRILLGRWRVLLPALAAVVIPVQLVSAVAQRGAFQRPGLLEVLRNPAALQGPTGMPTSVDDVLLLTGGSLLAALGGLLVSGVATAVAAAAVLGRRVDTGQAVTGGLRRWLGMIGVAVLSGLLILAVLVPAIALLAAAAVARQELLVVVGVVALLASLVAVALLYALLTAAVPVLFVEGAGPAYAIRRSFRLLRPRMWWVLGVMIVTAVLTGVLGAIVGGVFFAAGAAIAGDAALAVTTVGAVLATLLTVPIDTAVSVLVYFDGRVRHEGLDVALAAEQL